MRLSDARPSALTAATPLLALLVDEGRHATLPGGTLGARAAALTGPGKPFEGKARCTLLLHAEGGGGGPRALLLVGLGKAKDLTPEDWRRAAAVALRQAQELGAARFTLGVGGKAQLDELTLAALGEGLVLAGYRYPAPKPDKQPPKAVQVVSGVRGAAGILKTAQVLAEAANAARELGDLPGNIATPTHLVSHARKLGKRYGLRCKVHDKAALKRMQMGGILAVNQGSDKPPFLVELEYRPAAAKHTVCIVGKGLTFDAGGISIKPAASMEEMKYDMCGAAAVLGLMQALGELKPKGVRVVGLVATTENLLGGSAYKPGDVVTTASGKSIEVINTDAEGRVVLSDALHHATKFEPDAIIDLATLTGAIVVALGNEYAGLFSTDEKLAGRLQEAAGRTGEKLWPMPVDEAYKELIKGRFGDLKNSAGRWAGSCTAAQFLFHFSGGVPHAHIDIAGTAWNGRKRDYHVDGASGFGVRLLYDALTHW